MAEKPAMQPREVALDVLYDILGSLLFAIGIQVFSSPNNIAPGGATGLSVILNYLTGISIGMLSFLINVPLLIAAWFLLGRRFTLKTLKTVVVISVMLELTGIFVPVYHGETMLAALYGGVFEGVGLALVLMRGGTTGGSDVASKLLQLKAPAISVGRLILFIDGCVLITAAIVYRNIENALYGMIAIFTSTRILDSILYGLDAGRAVMIISDYYREISAAVMNELGRGCTRLRAEGSYTNIERPVLMCAVRRSQYYALKRIVYSFDENAFMVVLEAGEILGEGFKEAERG